MPTALLPERLVTRRDIADLFGVRPRTVADWERDGRLPPPIRVGRSPRWRADAIARLIADRPAD